MNKKNRKYIFCSLLIAILIGYGFFEIIIFNPEISSSKAESTWMQISYEDFEMEH